MWRARWRWRRRWWRSWTTECFKERRMLVEKNLTYYVLECKYVLIVLQAIWFHFFSFITTPFHLTSPLIYPRHSNTCLIITIQPSSTIMPPAWKFNFHHFLFLVFPLWHIFFHSCSSPSFPFIRQSSKVKRIKIISENCSQFDYGFSCSCCTPVTR